MPPRLYFHWRILRLYITKLRTKLRFDCFIIFFVANHILFSPFFSNHRKHFCLFECQYFSQKYLPSCSTTNTASIYIYTNLTVVAIALVVRLCWRNTTVKEDDERYGSFNIQSIRWCQSSENTSEEEESYYESMVVRVNSQMNGR